MNSASVFSFQNDRPACLNIIKWALYECQGPIIYTAIAVSKLTETHQKYWHSYTWLKSTHASSMLGWKILFMNPEKAKVEMKTFFFFFKSEVESQTMWSYIPSCDSRVPTYWWWFERVFVRKIYSHLPHASLVRCCTWGETTSNDRTLLGLSFHWTSYSILQAFQWI